MLDAAVDAHDVAGAELARLVADRHRHRALDDRHELLGVLVRVARDLLARLVDDPAQQDLVAADGVQSHAVDELEGRRRRSRCEKPSGSGIDAPVRLAAVGAERRRPRSPRRRSRACPRGAARSWRPARAARARASRASPSPRRRRRRGSRRRSPAAGRCWPSRRSPWRRTGPSTDGFSRITFSISGQVLERGREVGAELLAAVLDRRVVRDRSSRAARARGPSSRRPRSAPRRASG